MHADYLNPIIRQLRDQQVRFAPREKKIEQVDRAEKLLAELEAERTYTYGYLCYRITDYRPESFPNLKLSGADAEHDLRLFVDDLSDAAEVAATSVGERVLTVDELSKMFNVSTKTISRWRQQGLVSRRFVFDGRKRVGFLKSSVDQFVARNEDRVRRGARFSQLTADERGEIVERARRLARAGGCLADVTKRVAKHMGRSVETMRYTLKNFDQEHPDLAIFPNNTGPLRRGGQEENLSTVPPRGVGGNAGRALLRTKTSVYRVINEMRAARILELPLDFIPNPTFSRASFGSADPGGDARQRRAGQEDAAALGLAAVPGQPVRGAAVDARAGSALVPQVQLPEVQGHQAAHGVGSATRPKSSLMDEIESLYDQAVALKNQIVRANLRLVVSIAKRHVGQGDNFFELVSDGNMSLIRAVEKFDFARGNKFSTYASWAIMKNFARTIPDEHRHRDRFRTSHSEMFYSTEEHRTDQYEQESAQSQRERQIGKILGRLDEREQKIIISRFGLDHGHEPQTLKEVGAEMGVTKERIRQIEARALNKLRIAAREEKIEVPGPA